jgi:hypothetical protein
MISMHTRLAVNKGATLLDAVYPRWWENVDIDSLNMSNCRECVLGQLYILYTNGLNHLLGHHAHYTSADYGFTLIGNDRLGVYDSWENLREAWVVEIRLRIYRQAEKKAMQEVLFEECELV